MNPYDIIRQKRDGGALPPQRLTAFLRGYADGAVTDYHMAAFLMAVFFRGMEAAELDVLVDVMLHSGEVVDLSDVPGVKVDKHATGGVGDKVSLVLAPLVASLGVPVPMMSGRGLGHTGGTVDKLESIPGFRVELDIAAYRAQVARLGCALIAPSARITPLDQRLYALRDVTATVESIPLIAASIMSKKLAEGIDALVLDMKLGSGAFIPDAARAEELARTMIRIGAARGTEVVALFTAMDRPLGRAVGNALEVEEAVLALRGEGPADLREVTLALAAEMLVAGGAAADPAEGSRRAAAALDDGRALEKMAAVIAAQGGNPAILDDPALLPQTDLQHVVHAPRAGIVGAMDVRAIGAAMVRLGAGRATLEDRIDPAVGSYITCKPGDTVVAGEPLATVHARDRAGAEEAARALLQAIVISDEAPSTLPLVGRRLGPADLAD
ncbi:MAG: thymidine phosphorylase [Gemmatimonadota bacterium]